MDLKKTQKHIRNAWIAGIFSGTGAIIMLLTKNMPKEALYFAIVNVLLFYGLSFGVYKRSRACAIVIVVYYLFAKIILIITWSSEDVTNLIIFTSLAIAFLYFYSQGVRGTFVYHKLTKEKTR